jgi:hypothetical protein
MLHLDRLPLKKPLLPNLPPGILTLHQSHLPEMWKPRTLARGSGLSSPRKAAAILTRRFSAGVKQHWVINYPITNLSRFAGVRVRRRNPERSRRIFLPTSNLEQSCLDRNESSRQHKALVSQHAHVLPVVFKLLAAVQAYHVMLPDRSGRLPIRARRSPGSGRRERL